VQGGGPRPVLVTVPEFCLDGLGGEIQKNLPWRPVCVCVCVCARACRDTNPAPRRYILSHIVGFEVGTAAVVLLKICLSRDVTPCLWANRACWGST
jgi:hypothetical protein